MKLIIAAITLSMSPVLVLASEPAKVASNNVLGFRSLRDPVGQWSRLKTERRWCGRLSKKLLWKQIQTIHVLDLRLHVRDRRDVESFARKALEEAVLIQKQPSETRLKTRNGEKWIMLQALLIMKEGPPALLSIGHTGTSWLVIEHQGRMGLAVLKPR